MLSNVAPDASTRDRIRPWQDNEPRCRVADAGTTPRPRTRRRNIPEEASIGWGHFVSKKPHPPAA